MFPDHGHLPTRLVVVDHQVPSIATNSHCGSSFRPDEDVERVSDAGVQPVAAAAVRVPHQQVGGLVRDHRQQVSVLNRIGYMNRYCLIVGPNTSLTDF